MGWKDWNYWLKGGIIGAIVYLIIVVIWMFSIPPIKPTFLSQALEILISPFSFLGFGILIPGVLPIAAAILGFILGAIIGWIVGKIKNRNK